MEQTVIFILSSHETLKKLESLLEIRPAQDIFALLHVLREYNMIGKRESC